MSATESKTKYLKDYTPPTHLIKKTDLRFELGEDETIVTSKLQIQKNPDSQTDGHTLVLDGDSKHLKLLEVKVDGRVLAPEEYTLTDSSLTLNALPEACTLEIKTSTKPKENTELSGLYKSGEGAKELFCTQCEAEGFRNITYYLDRPDVLSEYTTEIVADAKKYPTLLSNGNPGKPQALADGRTSVTWHDPFPKPSYLFALIGGNMDMLEDTFHTMSGRDVKLRVYVNKGDLDKAPHAMASIKKAMAWDEKRFGREYDLDLFQIAAVDKFNAGAMENKGLNIFNASAILANPETATDAAHFGIERVIAHEYFHNWSGDRVTCRDWFQLSLKEGLTVFRDQEFSADTHNADTQRIRNVANLRSAQFAEDAGPMAHPIRPDNYQEIDNFYTRTVYDKGAEVIRMMQTLLGKDMFRKGTDLYFKKHDGQAVTTEDFVKCMEEVSGKDLSQFERTWYIQAGTPTLAITDEYDAKTHSYKLHVKQSTPPTPGQPVKEPFHIPLRVGLLDGKGDNMPLQLASPADALTAGDVLNVTKAEQTFEFKNVMQKPLPSLLRNFSAPVKVKYDYSRKDLAFLLQHDSDGFNRWEAGQKLALGVLQDMIAQKRTGQEFKIDPSLSQSLRKVLADPKLDKEMIAMMMTLPSEAYLAAMTQGPVDPEAIHAARKELRKSLGTSLASELERVYADNDAPGAYQFTTEDMARRSLKNMAMSYLAAAGNTTLAEKQFAAQANMTDVSAALVTLVNSDNVAAREKALAQFHDKWKGDSLVMDHWLGIQANSNKHCTLDKLKELMQHDTFDITNPNKVRALLASFASNNINFHAADGSGYRFFADQIIAYDKINKQVAARIVTPLTKWHQYDKPRADQMYEQLQRIMDTPGISANLAEIVGKSLKFEKPPELETETTPPKKQVSKG